TLEEMADKMNQGHELPPTCQDCRSPIRPNIVLFGEELPMEAYDEAMENLEDCDLLLVMGSSLVVYPVADMPRVVLRRHARLIIINLQPTQYDSSADVSLHMSLEEASRRLMEALDIKP
ncbi:MAG: Sir2 family NAD-dependent protein deacetylase, partial [Candidatus Brocadiales bacterium]|nr:Sir2 family NAD-dependent protein deacetylase [Candidatus Brocadiales bacterium]